MKNNKGITLIALVITIILLLILAGITINLTIGENEGIIKRAKEQQRIQDIAEVTEKLELKKADVAVDNYGAIEIEKYLEEIKKQNIIKEEDILDKWNIENGKCYIKVDDKYFYLLEQEENKNLKITYIENPVIVSLDTKTIDNTIETQVVAYNTKGAKYKYYIRRENEEYIKQAETDSSKYIYENLEQDIYYIKVEIEGANGGTTYLEKIVVIGGISVTNNIKNTSPQMIAGEKSSATININIADTSLIKGYYYSNDGGKTYTDMLLEKTYTYDNLTEGVFNYKAKIEYNNGNIVELNTVTVEYGTCTMTYVLWQQLNNAECTTCARINTQYYYNTNHTSCGMGIVKEGARYKSCGHSMLKKYPPPTYYHLYIKSES